MYRINLFFAITKCEKRVRIFLNYVYNWGYSKAAPFYFFVNIRAREA